MLWKCFLQITRQKEKNSGEEVLKFLFWGNMRCQEVPDKRTVPAHEEQGDKKILCPKGKMQQINWNKEGTLKLAVFWNYEEGLLSVCKKANLF